MTVAYVKRAEKAFLPREASLAAHALLERVLKEDFSFDVSGMPLCRNSCGKPYYESCPLHFNISHSGAYVVLAVSDMPVGIDVQTVTDIPERIMMRYIRKCPPDPLSKTMLWAEYESIGKCEGVGIPHNCEWENYYTRLLQLDGAVLCVCTADKENEMSFVYL